MLSPISEHIANTQPVSCLCFAVPVPQVPRSPKQVVANTIKRNCSIDLHIEWKHPRSDMKLGKVKLDEKLF